MTWKRRIWRCFLFALLAGVVANAIYFGLLFTRKFHGLSVAALGPAYGIVSQYLDPSNAAGSYGYLEEFGVNIVLYTFWIFVALLGITVLRQLRRKAVP